MIGHLSRFSLLAPKGRRVRLAWAGVLLLLGIVAACAPSIDERDAIHVLTYDGTVDPVMERYIDRGIDEAEDTEARAVVLRLDTPGGLVTSMEDIVKRINASEGPVIVYVSPPGAHAAAAGRSEAATSSGRRTPCARLSPPAPARR